MFGQGAARPFLSDPGNPPTYEFIREFPDSTSSWPKTVTHSAVEGDSGLGSHFARRSSISVGRAEGPFLMQWTAPTTGI